MNSQEKKEFVEIIKEANLSKSSDTISLKGATVTEWLFRALIGLSIWVGLGMKKEVEQQSENINKLESVVSTMQTKQEMKDQTFDQLVEFMKDPKFITENDFDKSIQPVITQLNKNTDALNSRVIFMNETTSKLQLHSFEITQLKERRK
jgi:hypothetical protein